MILEHTTHAGYIRQDDVYTDENGVNYTVSQDTFAAWAQGRMWIVSPDRPDYDTLCGIYADDPESAVKYYIENYIPHEPPQLETLF